jgi:Fe-S-cluster containining protein
MIKFVNKLRDYFDPPQSGTIEGEYYIRTGACHGCGQCCSGIHLIHGDKVIDSIEKWNKLKTRFEDYNYFIPVEENHLGVVFKCRNLQPDNSCGMYDDRPMFCKKYPTEDTLLFGGALSPQCGYSFKAKFQFDDILKKAAEKRHLKPGKLLNDVVPKSPPDETKVAG